MVQRRAVENGGTIHTLREEKIAKLLPKSVARTARMQFEKWHLLFREYLLDMNIPTCPYISLPGFKKTELANILQFLSTSSVLACLLCYLFSCHLFLVVSWLGICVEVTVDQTTSSLCFFFVCRANARDTQMTTRVTEGALVSSVFAARRSTLARACTPSQSTVNRPGDRLNFANLTSFLWSIRVQSMENWCRLVQKRRLFNSRKRFSATLV